MTYTISDTITNWLLKHGAIKPDELELYNYAVFNILHTFIPLIIVVIIGFFSNLSVECLLLLAPFLLLRKYCGGFHAKTQFRCIVFTIITQVVFMLIGYSFNSPYVFLLILLISTTTICILSPLNPEKRKLTSKDIKRCKKKSIQFAFSLAFICIIMLLFRYEYYSFFVGSGVMMVAFMQYLCILTKTGKKK